MALNLPKISVIVPVYNVENYVARCLDSIVNQDMTDIEIIVVNDGSTDDSGKICEQYASRDYRIKLINQVNQGLSMARNNGIAIARGDYIGFVDSDDWIKSDMYSTLYNNAIENNADITMVNFYIVRKSECYSYLQENSRINIFSGIYKIKHNIWSDNSLAWNKLYKRYLFNEITFPKGKIFEDIFTIYKLVDMANKMVISSECKYYYCRRDDSITLSRFNMAYLDRIEAYIERHSYLAKKYPNLEVLCRRQIYKSALLTLNKIKMEADIELQYKAVEKIKEMVSSYDYKTCGLSLEDQRMVSKFIN